MTHSKRQGGRKGRNQVKEKARKAAVKGESSDEKEQARVSHRDMNYKVVEQSGM